MRKKHPNQDTLQRFIFEQQSIRGVIVHLNTAYQAALKHHQYSAGLKQLTGEAMCAAALLSSTLKLEGHFNLQVQGNGPVSLLLAQIDHELNLRACAIANINVKKNFSAAVGSGHLLIDINPANSKERYQGVTEIVESGLVATIEHYFDQSEQLPTRLWVFSTPTHVAGLLLQMMPGEDQDYWNHIATLTETITAKELLSLANKTILHRLYHQETVRLFDADPISFRCRCSVEKMENLIIQLGQEEIDSLLKKEQEVKITCDFCGKNYAFDSVDVTQLFSQAPKVNTPKISQ